MITMKPLDALNVLSDGVSSSIYIAALMFNAATIPLAFCCLPHPAAVAFLVLQVILLVLPTTDPAPDWGKQLVAHSMKAYGKYSRLRIVYEDEDATFRPNEGPYVIGYEPHSVLPFGLPLVFSEVAPFRPRLGRVFTLATSAVNWCPIIRHLFFWLGGRSASRKSMKALLSEGHSIVLIPGGVAECAYMAHNKDVAFLKERRGFIRVALQHGAPLVPVYCFGQNAVYRCTRLGPPLIPQRLFDKMIRKILFCPMLVYGFLGSPIPFRVPLYMVIGRPIQVPKVEEPSAEQIQHYLDLFIGRLEQMYEQHKAKAGYPDSKLVVM